MSQSALQKEYSAPASATSGLAGYSLEGQRGPGYRNWGGVRHWGGVRQLLLDHLMAKGDLPGHEFHGNQWKDGGNPHQAGERGVLLGGTIDLKAQGVKPARRAEGATIVGAARVAWGTAMATGQPAVAQITPRGWAVLRSGEKVSYGTPHIVVTPEGKLSRYDSEFSKLAKTTTDQLAHTAATSPFNLKPQPTERQASAGNYSKGHMKIGGLDIAIENPAGSRRRPEWPEMTAHYGYVKRTEGADGDQVDVFVRVGTPPDYNGPAFVVNQHVAGEFDEHKVMVGWHNREDAERAYLSNYHPGWDGLHSTAALGWAEFKHWVRNGDTKAPLVKGDAQGHDFRGNQWTTGADGGQLLEATAPSGAKAGIKVGADGTVHSAFLPEADRGKGLGHRLYQLAHERLSGQGKTLRSGDVNADSRRVWQGLERRGEAEKTGSGWRMKTPIKKLLLDRLAAGHFSITLGAQA